MDVLSSTRCRSGRGRSTLLPPQRRSSARGVRPALRDDFTPESDVDLLGRVRTRSQRQPASTWRGWRWSSRSSSSVTGSICGRRVISVRDSASEVVADAEPVYDVAA